MVASIVIHRVTNRMIMTGQRMGPEKDHSGMAAPELSWRIIP